MRITEVAQKLRVAKQTVKQWITKKKLKAIHTKPQWGGHWFWDITEEDLEVYLKNANTKKISRRSLKKDS